MRFFFDWMAFLMLGEASNRPMAGRQTVAVLFSRPRKFLLKTWQCRVWIKSIGMPTTDIPKPTNRILFSTTINSESSSNGSGESNPGAPGYGVVIKYASHNLSNVKEQPAKPARPKMLTIRRNRLASAKYNNKPTRYK